MLILLTFVVSALSIFHFVRLGGAVNTILADSYNSIVATENLKDALEREDSAAAFYMAGEGEIGPGPFAQDPGRVRPPPAPSPLHLPATARRASLEDVRAPSAKQ